MIPDAEDLVLAGKAKASFDATDHATAAEMMRLLAVKYGEAVRHGNDGVVRHFETDAGGDLVITNMVNGRAARYARDAERVFRERLP